MSDFSTKIIISIGGSLLIATIVLTAVVASLFFHVSRVLKAVKEPDPEAVNCTNPASVTKDKVILAETTTTEPCPILQSCDACKMYADALPPCFCDINEGF